MKTKTVTSENMPSASPLSHAYKALPYPFTAYNDYIKRNACSVGQIENALRSLTYFLPGRFQDAEIVSETLHSALQLLGMYHDWILRNVQSQYKGNTAATSISPVCCARSRYTQFWTSTSPTYRRAAILLQIVQHTALLCEMLVNSVGGDKRRWHVVVLIEATKAILRLILLRTTKYRPLLSQALPARTQLPTSSLALDKMENDDNVLRSCDTINSDATATSNSFARQLNNNSKTSWKMPRTGLHLPCLPNPTQLPAYLVDGVLTADDIKPASKLLRPACSIRARASEICYILAPLLYAVLLSRARGTNRAWKAWTVGVALHIMALHLRERDLQTSRLEEDEWKRRANALGWWSMRHPMFGHAIGPILAKVRKRAPGLIGDIIKDYEQLWARYYFSVSS